MPPLQHVAGWITKAPRAALSVGRRGAAARTPFVDNIDYDAKGQREKIVYSGGATYTEYEYDDKTLRLTHLVTTRVSGNETLQDLLYTNQRVYANRGSGEDMSAVFQEASAQTLDDFLSLVGGHKVVISYVYESTTPVSLQFDFAEPEPGELYVAFNLNDHGEPAQARLRDVSALERRLGDPFPRPLPYWSAFVVGMGPLAFAFTVEDAREMVDRARAEVRMLWKAFEKK